MGAFTLVTKPERNQTGESHVVAQLHSKEKLHVYIRHDHPFEGANNVRVTKCGFMGIPTKPVWHVYLVEKGVTFCPTTLNATSVVHETWKSISYHPIEIVVGLLMNYGTIQDLLTVKERLGDIFDFAEATRNLEALSSSGTA